MMPLEENALESALRLAASEPAHRPEFCRLLLESTVLVLGTVDGHDSILNAGEIVDLQQWLKSDGASFIPFFSSLNTLQNAIERQENYLALPARALFETTKGKHLILNPRSSYGKEFLPDEISALLAGDMNVSHSTVMIEKATKVLLGQPKHCPSAIVSSLTTFFSKHAAVKAAYLAQIQNPAVDKTPHLVVGIEAEDKYEDIVRDAGMVVAAILPQGEFVDFIQIGNEKAGVAGYLKKVKPFYERTWGSKLKIFFQGHA